MRPSVNDDDNPKTLMARKALYAGEQKRVASTMVFRHFRLIVQAKLAGSKSAS